MLLQSIAIDTAAIAAKLAPQIEAQCVEYQALLSSCVKEAAMDAPDGAGAIEINPYGSNTPKAKISKNGTISCEWHVVIPHRYKSSLYEEGGYDRVNIVELFDSGYTASKRVYTSGNYGARKGYQVSLTHREPSMFIKRGVDAFCAQTGYSGSVT